MAKSYGTKSKDKGHAMRNNSLRVGRLKEREYINSDDYDLRSRWNFDCFCRGNSSIRAARLS
jgi:hypothetical protein